MTSGQTSTPDWDLSSLEAFSKKTQAKERPSQETSTRRRVQIHRRIEIQAPQEVSSDDSTGEVRDSHVEVISRRVKFNPRIKWVHSPSKQNHPVVRYNPNANLTEIEAGHTGYCSTCNGQAENKPVSDLSSLSQKVKKRAAAGMCTPQGYVRGINHEDLRGRMDQVIADYSARAQGAIRRGFLALVPPKTSARYWKLRELTNNFTDFESVPPYTLKELLRKNDHDCYKFVKAALSNDYSVLGGRYNRIRWVGDDYIQRANVELVQKNCGSDRGDLTDRHWLSDQAHIGAATAGPELKKQGFINLMDEKWGVSGRYKTEMSAPEGAVLVYQCARRGVPIPASDCYGDIAIRSANGFIRGSFTPNSITFSGKFVLKGIYIKPGGA